MSIDVGRLMPIVRDVVDRAIDEGRVIPLTDLVHRVAVRCPGIPLAVLEVAIREYVEPRPKDAQAALQHAEELKRYLAERKGGKQKTE